MAIALTAVAAGDVSGSLKSGVYTFNYHIRAIPAEHRAMANATHHLAVTITDAKKKEIANAKVSYAFSHGNKVEAQGDLMFMGAMPGHGEHHQSADPRGPVAMGNNQPMPSGGHYGADLTLPASGKYRLLIKAEIGGKVNQAAIEVVVP